MARVVQHLLLLAVRRRLGVYPQLARDRFLGGARPGQGHRSRPYAERNLLWLGQQSTVVTVYEGEQGSSVGQV
jgi:hypothetical protein